MRGQVATFPIDHITPRTRQGRTELDNLAVACPHCNARKWIHTQSVDPVTAEEVELFHPRHDRWEDHFRWSAADATILEGISAKGRATIGRLEMNDPNLIDIRRLLVELDLLHNLQT